MYLLCKRHSKCLYLLCDRRSIFCIYFVIDVLSLHIYFVIAVYSCLRLLCVYLCRLAAAQTELDATMATLREKQAKLADVEAQVCGNFIARVKSWNGEKY